MTRVKRGVTARARHKKIIKMAKGYRGRSGSCFRIALQRVEKALQYMYRDRRCKKRDFRALWIQRINAAVRHHGIVYSDFMHGLSLLQKEAGEVLNRKILSDMAVHSPETLSALIERVKAVIPGHRCVKGWTEL
ncbi:MULTISPECIES: 50S ribosomal protein L20 [Holospora]|uniref:Large ribosomal subunit protein bL20 n=2 Tax=Holospora TaxID=44747 RepID=A0A061JI82_9PROT|nr:MULTISPECIES: 50S ribosomal protein L20 [Holospora]ETZ04719.1 50S ribosomal protein L20 [Holospora undulata HU1]GAJ45918.1 50S ribosomal protein L20 [Holospora elegans E1]